MVDDISAADPRGVPRWNDRTDDRFGQIIIVGGGCYGSYYVRQLQRAARAGAIAADGIIVVDRNRSCRVAIDATTAEREPWPLAVELRYRDWRAFFDEYLGTAAETPSTVSRDAIVPSPLMPHLMAEWLVTRAKARWPTRTVETRRLERVPALPWERAGADGTHYVSYATWTCPVNCVEPRTCPHTKGPRDWSLTTWLPRFAASTPSSESPEHRTAVVLHCRHRAYGVGMFATSEVIAGDEAIRAAGERGAVEVLIGTVSHCHGAVTRLVVGT